MPEEFKDELKRVSDLFRVEADRSPDLHHLVVAGGGVNDSKATWPLIAPKGTVIIDLAQVLLAADAHGPCSSGFLFSYEESKSNTRLRDLFWSLSRSALRPIQAIDGQGIVFSSSVEHFIWNYVYQFEEQGIDSALHAPRRRWMHNPETRTLMSVDVHHPGELGPQLWHCLKQDVHSEAGFEDLFPHRYVATLGVNAFRAAQLAIDRLLRDESEHPGLGMDGHELLRGLVACDDHETPSQPIEWFGSLNAFTDFGYPEGWSLERKEKALTKLNGQSLVETCPENCERPRTVRVTLSFRDRSKAAFQRQGAPRLEWAMSKIEAVARATKAAMDRLSPVRDISESIDATFAAEGLIGPQESHPEPVYELLEMAGENWCHDGPIPLHLTDAKWYAQSVGLISLTTEDDFSLTDEGVAAVTAHRMTVKCDTPAIQKSKLPKRPGRPKGSVTFDVGADSRIAKQWNEAREDGEVKTYEDFAQLNGMTARAVQSAVERHRARAKRMR